MLGEEIDKVEKELSTNSMTRHVIETKNSGNMEVYVEVVASKQYTMKTISTHRVILIT